MSTPTLGTLELARALDRPELLAEPVLLALQALPEISVWSAPIDGTLSDTATFCEHYDVPLAASANCVIVAGKRSGHERHAATVQLATTRADVNGAVRRRLDVRKISFAPVDDAVARTGMEYGGITPIGVPTDWPILIDEAAAGAGLVVIGAGIRAAKLVIDGADLARLPGADVIFGLAG